MERKLAAIFSTDVQGYSRLMGEDEAATVRTITAYRKLMATLIDAVAYPGSGETVAAKNAQAAPLTPRPARQLPIP